MKAFLKSIIEQNNVYTAAFNIHKSSEATKLIKYLGKPLTLSIDELKQKRTLTQNAYAWALITQIAEALTASKEEIYFQMLRDYGQRFQAAINSADAERFEKSQKYFLTDEIGKDKNIYTVFVGSSLYDTAEMAKFINGIITEAEYLDINTLTPEEIARMKLI